MAEKAPSPPMSDWEMNPPEVFPTFMRIKQDADKHQGLHSISFAGMKTLHVLSDTTNYESIFSPGEHATTEAGAAIDMDMDRLANSYFNVHMDVCPYTRPGLDGLRVGALNPNICGQPGGLNDIVCEDIMESIQAMPDSGEMNLLQVAEFTFAGVNRALFGAGVVPPEAEKFFYDYDDAVASASMGMGKNKEYKKAYKRVEDMFLDALKRGHHKSDQVGRGMKGRLSPLPEDTDLQKQASFMCSIFWAPQANTLPMTYWTLAHVLNNPDWFARVRAEADIWGGGANGHFKVDVQDDKCLPFTRACMNETLRMYIANISIRKVHKDFEITMKGGERYHIPVGDNIFVTSYTTHYDENVFPDPYTYRPERWLDASGAFNEKAFPYEWFIPFGKGRYSCSGRHLLTLELPSLVALFVKTFDVQMVDPLPEADWAYVVASVRPKGWPHNFENKIRFSRRKTSKL